MKITFSVVAILSCIVASTPCSAFVPPSIKKTTKQHSRSSLSASSFFYPPPQTNTPTLKEDPTFLPPDPSNAQITDPDCISAASQMKRILVPVPPTIHPSGEVGISYIHWPRSAAAAQQQQQPSNLPPILLLHGFDSSCLEYRRLGPQLSSLGLDVYAVDLLGWGFTQLPTSSTSQDYSANAKIQTLRSFWKTLTNNQPVAICGSSLGGAAAIQFASGDDENEQPSSPATSCILMDAQGFVDGTGPILSLLPTPIAKLGISVLQSIPLRNAANQMSYFDKETYATEDALNIGRLHCLQDGWDDGMLNFMVSGGFKPVKYVPKVMQRTCVIWGEQDDILEKEFAYKFMEVLPNKEENELHWISECGHVPHLEQPEKTARVIYEFLTKGSRDVGVVEKEEEVGKKGVGVVAVSAAAVVVAAAASLGFNF